MTVIDVAIVGSGIIGAHHAKAIARHPGLRVTALVDARIEAAEALAATLDPRPSVHLTLAEALSAQAINLVSICTPSGLHIAAAEETLAAGAHLLIEKPLDTDLAKARAFAKVAEEAATRGLVTSVVSQHRFDPATVAVGRAVREHRLGRVTSAVVSMPWWRDQAYYDSAGWRGTWEFDGGGALANQGIHLVDQMLALLGRPAEVYAQTALLSHERIEVEDVAAATIRFESGALAVLHATTGARPGLPVRLALYGTEGSAVLQDDQLEYFHTTTDPQLRAADLVPPQDVYGAAKDPDGWVTGHLRQYQDLVDAIGSGRAPGVQVRHGLEALALVRSVYVSAGLGRAVSFSEVLDGAFDDIQPSQVTPNSSQGANQ
ncbi:Gfo/Idh/MocA family protein [Dactylosporangium matsuzakiense]|uniref:Oxidoreductase n=1 Tax=Dactylosporangium matsuzakiense TaxID=53360 RepID=A0A9W6NQL8_9ACTN|nr:Gfo/Idh/MocA family oxidoreductase [Dactylosporangium matsuzakiense]UWZ47488.1 Gfo/Idh/MocA family oxidoreductase [Dactylosporangium matsuzakiense]GLL05247.1 oxidoreductase [Dactylosporangium matsuzakiense]